MVIVLIILAAYQSGKKAVQETNAPELDNANLATGTENPAAISGYDKEMAPAAATTSELKDAVVAVSGANPITKDNQVVTATGEPVKTDARVMAEDAPRPTGLLDKASLPASLAKITVTAAGFSPKQFTTQKGAPTTFSLTSGDEFVHVIVFEDPSLSAVAMLVGPGQTRAITFPAPDKAGEYIFRDDTPTGIEKGITGKMIVK